MLNQVQGPSKLGVCVIARVPCPGSQPHQEHPTGLSAVHVLDNGLLGIMYMLLSTKAEKSAIVSVSSLTTIHNILWN